MPGFIFPEIPNSWLIAALMVGLIILRAYGIDSWTTAALSIVIGYMTGKHIQQVRREEEKNKENML